MSYFMVIHILFYHNITCRISYFPENIFEYHFTVHVIPGEVVFFLVRLKKTHICQLIIEKFYVISYNIITTAVVQYYPNFKISSGK